MLRFLVLFSHRDGCGGGLFDLPCATSLEAWDYLERERPWWVLKRVELVGRTP